MGSGPEILDSWQYLALGPAYVLDEVHLGPREPGHVHPAHRDAREQPVQRVLVLVDAARLVDALAEQADVLGGVVRAALEESHALADHVPPLRDELLAERDHAVAQPVELHLLPGIRE